MVTLGMRSYVRGNEDVDLMLQCLKGAGRVWSREGVEEHYIGYVKSHPGVKSDPQRLKPSSVQPLRHE